MNTILRLPLRHAALSVCFTLALSATAAHAAEPAINGRIHHVQADTLDVCFDRGHSPAVGEHVQLIRHEFSAPPKSVQTMKSSTVGAAEIVAVKTDRCASAHLLEGNARALDWVAAQP